MQIVDNKLLLFRTRSPHKYALIPKCKIVDEPTPGLFEVAVKWGIDEVKVLRNLGVKNVPSPIQGTYDWPGRYKPFQHQIVTSSFLTMNPRAYVLNQAGCVDSETEYLSPTGWKKISEYDGGKVAQYNLNEQIEFVEPTAYVKLPCEDMIRFKTKYGIDQLLSPEHRVLAYSSDKYEKRAVMSAAYIKEIHDDSRRGFKRPNARRAGTNAISFTHTALPAAFFWTGGEGLALSDAQLRVQIATIADAHFPGASTRCVVRIKKQRKVERLRALLTAADIEYVERLDTSATGAGFYVFSYNAPLNLKKYDSRFWECTAHQLEIVRDEVMHWDGADRGPTKGGQFFSVEKESADFVQFAFSCAGKIARITEDVRDGRNTCYVVTVRGDDQRFLTLKSRHNDSVFAEPSTDGFKYCFSVPSTFLVFRRNGCVFASGNTGKTSACLWAADYLMKIGRIRRVLIVCPLSIMEAAWMKDIMTFVIHRKAAIAHASTMERRREIVESSAEFVIINYDGVEGVMGTVKKCGDFDLIIADEANFVKNDTTRRWKALNAILTPDTWLWALTGTPAPQGPMDAYGLAKLVTPHTIPKFRTAWRDKTMNKITQFKWVAKPEAPKLVHAALQPAIRFTKEMCLDLPPILTTARKVAMSAQQDKYYRLMKVRAVMEAAGEMVTAVNAATVLNKLLQISCIEYNTPVLTDAGWLPLFSVSQKNKVWDGEAWVSHDGAIYKGTKNVVVLDGVRMTPDHKVLTNSGWATAQECIDGKSCQRLNRASVRLPNSYAPSGYDSGNSYAMCTVGMPMRLRYDCGASEPVSSYEVATSSQKLRMPHGQRNAQNVKDTTLQNLVGHAKALCRPKRQRLPELRGAWNFRMSRMGRIFRELLEGCAGRVQRFLDIGAERQRAWLLQTELPVGVSQTAIKQHQKKRVFGYSERTNDSYPSCRSVRNKNSHANAAPSFGLADRSCADGTSEQSTPVYDILNCGPRNRFVVRGANGELLIVHNCGSVYSDEQETVVFDCKPRLNALDEILADTDRKVLIFAAFRHSIDTIIEHLDSNGVPAKHITGDVTATKRGEIFNDFQTKPNPRVLVIQPQAASHGVTLTEADTVVFWGPVMSVETYLQCIARAHRIGQVGKSVTVVHLYSSDIESKMFKQLEGKVEDHNLIVKLYDDEMKSI